MPAMLVKIALAIIYFCFVYLGSINAQSQQFDDKEFEILKRRDWYKPKVQLPTRSPQNQNRNDQENQQQNVGNKNTPLERTKATRTQNPSQDNKRILQPNTNNRPNGYLQFIPYMLFYQQQQQQQLLNSIMQSYQYQQSSQLSYYCMH